MQYQIVLAALAASAVTVVALPQASSTPAKPAPPKPNTLDNSFETLSHDLEVLSENIAITGKSDRSSGSWNLARTALADFAKSAHASAPHSCPPQVIKAAANASVAEEYVNEVEKEVIIAYHNTKKGESSLNQFCLADEHFEAVGVFVGAIKA